LDEMGIEFTEEKPPLHFLEAPLKKLLEKSTEITLPAGYTNETPDAFPILYTEYAYKQAECFSRKGAVDNPLFESGCILAGSACQCPETGEFYLVIDEVYEATGAKTTLTSMEYGGEDWRRIMTIIKARRRTH
ncbi:unnamed protein product, partial [marine sediment metagenome]